MKATNLDNLKRLKRALQKQKLERIDSLRMQVGRCDRTHNVLGEIIDYGVTQSMEKDPNGRLIVVNDYNWKRPLCLLSNTAETTIETITNTVKSADG